MQHPLARTALVASSLVAGLAVSLAGCAASQPAWEDDFGDSASSPTGGAPAAEKPRSPPGRFARAEVDEVLLQGPVWILRRVVPEEVVRDGAFVGWRLAAIPEEWRHLAIKPGDVVTRVNGASIERPNDLWAAWVGLASAKELRVAYEREEAARELVMPIDGPPTEAVVAKLQSNAPPPRPPRKPKGTIVIEEGSAPPGEESADAASGPRESVSVSGDAKGEPTKDGAGRRDGAKKK